MLRRVYPLILGLLLSLQLSGCTTLTGESLGQNVDDTTITTEVYHWNLAGSRI